MPYITPDTPSDTGGRILFIPDTYLPAVNGALVELTEFWNWEAFGTETVDDAVTAMETMLSQYLGSDVSALVKQTGILPFPLRVTPSDPLVWTADGSQITNGYWNWSIVASGKQHKWTVTGLTGQTIRFGFIGQTNNAMGELRIKLDGVLMSTIDFYSSALARNAVLTSVSGTFLMDGAHEIIMICESKNASSSNYNIRLSEVSYRID